MSTLANKRRKLSKEKEYECSESSEVLKQDIDPKIDEDLEAESKSELQSSTISHENRDSSRASGLVRRRKKKVFEDYYYGDEIFSKPKNASKKKNGENKDKEVKPVKKQKSEKTKKSIESIKETAKIKVKDEVTTKTQKSKTNSSLIHSIPTLLAQNGMKALGRLQSGQKEVKGAGVSKESNRLPVYNNSLGMPMKPIPQRANGSNLNFLLNACRINNSSKISAFQKQDEGHKKREDKALEKSIQNMLSLNMLSNSENPMLGNKPIASLSNMQEALAAILNMSKDNNLFNVGKASLDSNQPSVEDKGSSSEIEDNSKLRTPTKQHRDKRPSHRGYNEASPRERSYKNNYYAPKRPKGSLLKTPKKLGSKPGFEEEDIGVSRVKKTVHEDGKTSLILEKDNVSAQEMTISFDIPSKKLTDSFSQSVDLPNLNKCFGLASSVDAMKSKIKALLEEKYSHHADDHRERRYDSNMAGVRINSIPVLFVNDLHIAK